MSWGGGKRLVLAVELERQNTIYFADPEIVQKAQSNNDPYLAGIIFRLCFKGSGNSIYIGSNIRFRKNVYIDIKGNNNTLLLERNITIDNDTKFEFIGNDNFANVCENCIFSSSSKLVFKRNNNYLYIGPNTKLGPGSIVDFMGVNGLAYFCGDTSVNINSLIGSDNIVFWGWRFTSGINYELITERENIIIGSDCMLSQNVYMRNGNGHAIYDAESHRRICRDKSIIVSDHVWLGRNVKLLTGAQIGYGTLIGTAGLVSGKKVPNNCIAAGIPVKVIRENILWTRSGVGGGNKARVELFEFYTEPDSKPKMIGCENLLKIDSIDSEISSKDKFKLIQNILDG